MIYADVKKHSFVCFDCGNTFKVVSACPKCNSTNSGFLAESNNRIILECDNHGKPLSGYGGIIRHARKQLGLSQRMLAEQLGVHKATILHYEAEKYMPLPTLLARLAKVLQLKLAICTGSKGATN